MTAMIEELLERLQTTDPLEKRDTLESLSDYPCDDRALEGAANLLMDPDRGVREAASRLLILCSSDKAASLVAAHISSLNIAVRNLAGDALVRMKSVAVRALLPYVDSADKDIRKFTIDLLAQLPSDEIALERIGEHPADPDPNVMSACVDAIGGFHATTYYRKLMALYDKYELLRPNIIYAVSKFEHKPGLQFLLTALSGDDPVVQLAAAEVLATRKDSDTLKILLLKLNSVSDLAKPVILHSLVALLESEDYAGEIPKSLKRDLIKMLDDNDPVYIRAAVRGLRYFIDGETLIRLVQHSGLSESIDNAIVSVLKDLPEEILPLILEDAAHDVRVAPLAKTSVLLLDAWNESNREIKPDLMQRFVLFISRSFPRLDIDTKITALTVSGNLSAEWGVQVVRAALSDRESAVKNYAIDLTAKLGHEYFTDELKKLSADYDEETRLAAASILHPQNIGFQN